MEQFDFTTYARERAAAVAAGKEKSTADVNHQKMVELGQALPDYTAQYNAERAADSTALAQNLDSFGGAALNMGVSFANRVTDIAGNMGQLPLNSMALSALEKVTDESIDAAHRVKTNEGTFEDVANLSRQEVGKDSQAEYLDTYQKNAARAKAVQNFFDISGRVNNKNQRKLVADTKEGLKESIVDFEKAKADWDNNEYGSAYKSAASGVAGTVANVAKSAYNNPQASGEIISGVAADLLLARFGGTTGLVANSAGGGAELYAKGVEEFAKANGGKLPNAQERVKLMAWSASWAAADFLGDKVLGGAGKTVGKATDKAAEVTSKITNEAFKKSLGIAASVASSIPGRAVTGAIKGGSGEFVTEGYQAIPEAAIEQKDATLEDVLVSGTMGAIGGGGVRSANDVVTGGPVKEAKETNKTPAPSAEQKKAFYTAAESGDVSGFTDKESPTYNPGMAIGALSANSKQEATAPEKVTENLAAASTIMSTLEEELTAKQGILAAATSAKPEDIAELKAGIAKAQEALTNTDVADTARIEKLNTYIERLNVDLNATTAQGLAAMKASVSKLTREVSTARMQYDEMVSSAPKNKPVANKAKDSIIRSMLSPNMESTEAAAMAGDTTLSITPTERSYLKKYQAAKNSVNALLSMSDVSNEVYAGNPKRNNLGIKDYRQKIGTALHSNNKAQAERFMSLLENFAVDHRGKSDAVAAAYDEASDSGAPIILARNAKTKAWEVVEAIPAGSKKGDGTVLTITPSSANLVEAIRAEADAIDATYGEMDAAYEMVNAPVVPVAAKAAPSAKAEASKNNLSNVSDTVFEQVGDLVVGGSLTEGMVSSAENIRNGKPVPTVKVEETVVEPEATSITPTEAKEEVTQETPATEPGDLAVFAREPSKEEDYRGRNLVADNFTQKGGSDKSGSTNALVKVKDFWSQVKAGKVKLEDYLKTGEALNEYQRNAIKMFSKAAKLWSPILDANLLAPTIIDGSYTNFAYQDLMVQLIEPGEATTLDENAKTALFTSAFNWIADASRESAWMTDSALNKLLGIADKKNTSFSKEQRALRNIGVTENSLINSLGQAAVAAMGLKLKANAPQNLITQLEGAVGAHIVKMLEQKDASGNPGFITRTVISGKTMAKASKKKIDERADFNFLKLTRPEGKGHTPGVQAIKDATKGSSDVLSKLFSIERSGVEPSFEPKKFSAKNPKNSGQAIPESIAAAAQKVQDTANFIREDKWKLFNALSFGSVLAIAGAAKEDKEGENPTVHISNRISNKAKNDGLANELQNFLEFGDSKFDDESRHTTAFYLEAMPWVHQRMGITTNMVNPQSSKIVRFALSRESWNVEVNFDGSEENQPMFNNFLLRVGEGLGVKTENQDSAKNIETVLQRIKDPVYEAGVKAIQELVYGNEPATAEQEKAITAAVEKAGEKMHSFDVLTGLAHYQQAVDTNKTSFRTDMLGEIDGKANGPMLSLLMLGAGDTPEQLREMLEMGGFYSKDSKHKQYNEWLNKTNGKDLYQKVTSELLKNVNKSALGSIEKFVGALSNPNGDVSSAGRKFIKTPLTALMFGSSMFSAQQALANSIIEAIYTRIEKVAKAPTDAAVAELVADINAFGNGIAIVKKGTTIEEMMENEFSKDQLEIITASIQKSINKPLKKTLEGMFGSFLTARDNLNMGANIAFTIYNGVYQGLRETFIANRIADGSMPSNKQGKALRDLTQEEENNLREEIAQIKPLMHTAASVAEGNIEAGVYMGKSSKATSMEESYTSKVKFKDKTTKLVRGQTKLDIAPELRSMILAIHSTDSAISQWATMMGDVLNVHDAHVTGLNNFTEVGKNLNAMTWKATLGYSPMGEVATTLNQLVVNVAKMLKEKKTTIPTKLGMVKALQGFIEENSVKLPEGEELDEYTVDKSKLGKLGIYNLRDAVNAISHAAIKADTARLTFMAGLGAIDQYPTQGGSYEPTDKDRQEAQNRLNAIPKKPNAMAEAAAGEIDAFIQKTLVAYPNLLDKKVKIADLEIEVEESVDELTEEQYQALSLTDNHIFGLSSVELATILATVAANPKWNQEGKTIQQAVLAGTSLVDAVAENLSYTEATDFIQEMGAVSRSMDGGPWGQRGASAIKSDPRLVEFFSKNPKPTGQEVMAMLKGVIKPKTANRMLLERLRRGLPEGVQFQFVTPETPMPEGMDGAATKSRGWYYPQNNTVYLASSAYKHSGLTSEVVLHELLHAILGSAIDAGIDSKDRGGVKALMRELSVLHTAAKKYIAKNGMGTEFDEAVKDLHEFVSYGMTNRAFQAKVLNMVSVPKSTTTKNAYVKLAQKFYDALTSFLFATVDGKQKDLTNNALAQLTQNVAGLFEYAAQSNQSENKQGSLIRSMVSPANDPSNFNTVKVFEALGNLGPVQPSSAFSEKLQGVLTSVSEMLFGPAGSLKETAEANLGIAPEDVYLMAALDGKTEFATEAKAAGFVVSEQESFVLDQVEATVSAALHDGNTGSTYVATNRLSALYREAYRTMNKPEAFHEGDWASATAQEKAQATAMHAFLFKVTAGGKFKHLSRFAAMVMAHEGMNKLMEKATLNQPKDKNAKETIVTKMAGYLDALLDHFGDMVSNTRPGQPANEKVTNLVNELVKIELKRKATLKSKEEVGLIDSGLEFGNSVVEGALAGLLKFGSSSMFKNRTFIKAGVSIAKAVGQGRADQILEEIARIRDDTVNGKHGLAMGIFNELKSPKQAFLAMLMGTKNIEKNRKFVATETSRFVREGFVNKGADLSQQDKQSVTRVLLRTGAHSLLDGFDVDRIAKLMKDPAERTKAINEYEAKIAVNPQARYYSNQAKALGFTLVNGGVKGRKMVLNARSIVLMEGMIADHGLTEPEAKQAIKDVDVLTTLYALKYSKGIDLKTVATLLEKEMARTDDGGNGIITTLMQHKALEKDARKRLFQGQENLMAKGYMPEVVNPYVELEAVPEGPEMDALLRVGFTRMHPLPKDITDPDQTVRVLMVRKGSGLAPYHSGIVTMHSAKAKGTKLHNGNVDVRNPQGADNMNDFNAMMKNKDKGEAQMLNGVYDPETDDDVNAAPVFNPNGEIVNFRYMMDGITRDTVLERDNRFDELMGALAGGTYDKATTPEHNSKVTKALLELSDAEFGVEPRAFANISPTSADPELREMWNMLPYEMRQEIRDLTGKSRIAVRYDMLNLVMGYRKYSMGHAFDKQEEERNHLEHAFVWALEETLETYGKASKMSDAEVTALVQTARTKVVKGERMWQEAVGIAKDNIVVKTVTVLVNNILSNGSLLRMSGVPFGDIIKHHQVAYKATKKWGEDSAKLFALEQEQASGATNKTPDALQKEIDLVKNSMDANPVKPLIEAGLMPSIVEDMGQEESPFSYKAKLSDYVEEKSKNLNPTLVKGLKTVYMSGDGKIYQTLSEITQLSDFVARYTLYEHLTTRRVNPLSHDDAVFKAAEYFINYDVPMHKMMQYSDDMGLTMFTKYFLRIQRVLMTIAKENPAQTLGMFMFTELLDVSGSVLDAGAWTRLGNNPFHIGALQLPGSLTQIATIEAALGVVK